MLMKNRWIAGSLALVLLAGSVWAADNIKSGPQVGETIPGPFSPLNVNGSDAGQKHCLVCENGTNPVAMIFAREMSGSLASLVKKVDEATSKNSGQKMGSFVVFCSDAEGLEKQLKTLVDKEKLKKIVLAIDNPSGPTKYAVAKDADVTVVLYDKHKVKANFVFKKGQLTDAEVDKVIGAIDKTLLAK